MLWICGFSWSLLALFITVYCQSDIEEDVETTTEKIQNITCPNYDSDVLIASVLGKWFIKEIYLHLDYYGTQELSICPVVTISEGTLKWYNMVVPKHKNRTEYESYHVKQFLNDYSSHYRGLRLIWDEAGKDLEYSLHFKNDSQGYWVTAGGQNGTLTSGRNYREFEGAVQVLKAVENHILLNFCQAEPPQLFSVLLSREPQQLKRWEIKAAHELLRRKHLSINTRRLVCGNGKLGLRAGFGVTLVTLLFGLFAKIVIC